MYKCALLLLQILIVFLFTSCREEILAPGNFAGNINEPIQDNRTNYYGIIINAKNLTSNISAYTNFSYHTTKTLLTITDLEAGSITFTIRDKQGVSLYRFSAGTEVTNDFRKITSAIPGKVEISFNNFSGKMKFSLSYHID